MKAKDACKKGEFPRLFEGEILEFLPSKNSKKTLDLSQAYRYMKAAQNANLQRLEATKKRAKT